MKILLIIALSMFSIVALSAIGDVLTIIQKPILSVPQITTPGESFTIECDAPAATAGWQAALIYEDISLPLTITAAQYMSGYARWFLTVTTPQPQIYELYDLQVSASGIVTDIARNAVHLIPSLKTNYKFIQITDAHLPTEMYYYEQGSENDSTCINDLRAVIQDINLIHPEFVLFTGDVVHEGELEEFQGREYYTKAKRVLGELEVPVYLVSGNHDIGGWNSTPPPDGTARQNWWRFFGWQRLYNPPASDFYYTQNYTFNYGEIAFIGMESYINYDDYLWYRYGDESFTSRQMQWLHTQLNLHASDAARVLFYHYDFSEQLNLASLNVNMALWGHIHYSEGSIYSQPYNLGTDNLGGGTRAFRIVNVINNALQPLNTSYAGSYGQSLTVNYSPSNIGIADSVSATITNNYGIPFQDMRLKFIMPPGLYGYNVTGGTLLQIMRTPDQNTCYISVDVNGYANAQITVSTDYSNSNEDNSLTVLQSVKCYPNPFSEKVTVSIQCKDKKEAFIEIFNVKGQKVKTLAGPILISGNNEFLWDSSNEKSGIYFLRVTIGSENKTHKLILLK
ncbi:MAG: metallophosphoesterase [Candidatus Cloacimonetes bacterium]|nr:metallophosphoesterase [Candidatus Cloacimonadota bacterium]